MDNSSMALNEHQIASGADFGDAVPGSPERSRHGRSVLTRRLITRRRVGQ